MQEENKKKGAVSSQSSQNTEDTNNQNQDFERDKRDLRFLAQVIQKAFYPFLVFLLGLALFTSGGSIAHAAFLGNQSGGAATCSDSGNYIFASSFTMPTSTNGTVNDIGMWFHAGDGGNQWAGAIYTSNAGQPYQIVAVTATGTIPVGNVTATLPIDPSYGAVTLNAGQTYFIGYNHGENGAFDACRYDAGSTNQSSYKSYSFPQVPLFMNPFLFPDGNLDWSISIWADYTPLVPPTGTTAFFVFPNNSTLNTVPDFTNWKIGLGASPGQTINGKIEYQMGNVWTYVNKIYSDSFFYNMGTDNSALLPILKNNTLWGSCSQSNLAGCTQQWIAEIYLNGSNATSAEQIFNIRIGTSTVQLTSSTQNVGPFLYNPFQLTPSNEFVSVASSVASLYASSTGCPVAKDWTDIGGGLSYAFCSTINFLFVPGAVGLDQISSTVSSLEGVPPYSWFFQVNNQIVSSASSTPTSTGLAFTDVPTGFGHSSTITILKADPSTDINLTRITKYGPQSLLSLIWNAFLVGVIILIVVAFYKLVL